MATVIDTLVLELGLDPSKFTDGEKAALAAHKRTIDAMLAGGKEIESQGKKLTEYFEGLKREALTVLALFMGGKGIKEFTSYVTSLDAATARSAYTMNMATKELSAWQGAMEQNGGSAESMTSSMSGLSSEMNKFMLTGQASFLPVLNRLGIGLFDANKNLKTSADLMLDIADAVKGMDPARAQAFLSMIPGMNPDTVNLLIQGRTAVEGYLAAARQAGGTTNESAEAAKKYQQNLSLLERSATSLGRALTTFLAPAINAVFTSLTKLIQGWNITAGSPEAKQLDKDFKASTEKHLGKPQDFLKLFLGPETYKQMGLDEFYKEEEKAPAAPAPPGGPPTSDAAREARIRQIAKKEGVDPNVAVRVWESEGKRGVGPSQQSTVINSRGQREQSFGPFQLYMGGGLGNTFQKQTGLDPRDPNTFDDNVRFSMREAKKSGWGAWHGYKGGPWDGIRGGNFGATAMADRGGDGGSKTTNTTTIGKLEVHTAATDADGITRDIKPAIERANFAASANSGQQ